MEPKEIILSGNLELYCLGLTSKTETSEIEAWAKEYNEVAMEIESIKAGLEDYAKLHGADPRSEIKEKLFTRIKFPVVQDKKNAVVSNIGALARSKYSLVSPVWKWSAAAAVVLLITSSVFNLVYFNKYQSASNELSSSRELLTQEKAQHTEMKHDMDIVHNRYSVPVSLKGMEQMPDATAKIFWIQNTGEVMVDASNLPDAPDGKQYQFWAIIDGIPVDGGMIITNDKGIKFRMQKMKAFGKVQAFAISLEKTGGNPKPTEVVSMGKI